jgi:hypothetical protein
MPVPFLPPRSVRTVLLGWVVVTGLAACSRSPSEPAVEPPVACTPANTVSLPVGGAIRLSGAEARTVCVGGGTGAEFLLVPVFAAADSGRTLRLEVAPEGTRASVAPPRPTAPFEAPGADAGHGGHAHPALLEPLYGDPTDAFHAALREREARELRGRVLGGGPSPGGGQSSIPRTSPAPVPTPGSLLTLNAQPKEACSNALPRTGRVEVVSEWAIVVVDTLSPAQGFSRADLESIAAVTDTLLIPLVHRAFGTFTDLDGNGRVILFFTPEVNRLTESGSERSVGGFFFARDLFPRTTVPNRFEGCATSNVGEVLYLLVPDPAGTINGNRRTVDTVRRSTPATIVHELQHLVNAARRLHILGRTGAAAFETVWLNEGLSHLAEELAFFQASGLAPRSNLALSDLQATGSRAINAVNQYHVSNLLRLRLYLEAPQANAPTLPIDRLETRGATQTFLRYLLDRGTAPDDVVLRALVDAPSIGWASLVARVGTPRTLESWLSDWAVALYADERVTGLHPDHQLRSWSHPSLFAGLGITAYPLATRGLVSGGAPLDLALVAGGSAYLRFGVDAGGTGRIVFSSGQAPLPPELRVTLLRTH